MAASRTGLIAGALAGIGVAAAAFAGAGLRTNEASAATSSPAAISANTPMFAPPPGAPLSFADIFEKVSPAVVSIDVTSRAQASGGIPGLEGLPFGIVPKGGQDESPDDQEDGERGARRQSSGSGFFISADGYLVTNNHVVEGAEDIKVNMKDGRVLAATIVGRDQGTDLAVLKVQGNGFTFVNFERSAKPRVGDWVISIGNPFGLGGTATAGIVSAFGRDIGDTAFVDYIQIDAPINRGNSGGPTFDIYGRVIGVNTAIFSPSGGSVGIGFAIPADIADTVTRELISGKKVTRGYIGATIQNFTPEMADAQGIPGQKGALVADLVPGGPAQKGGLLPGDLVVAVNGETVTSNTELTRSVARGRPGETLRLEVIRDGKRKIVEVRSGTRPSESDLASGRNGGGGGNDSAPEAAKAPPVLGLALAPVDDAARRKYSLEDGVKGVVIEGIKPDSTAAEASLRRGDVISSVNNRPVVAARDVADAVDAARKAGRGSVLFGFTRGGQSGFVAVKIPK